MYTGEEDGDIIFKSDRQSGTKNVSRRFVRLKCYSNGLDLVGLEIS